MELHHKSMTMLKLSTYWKSSLRYRQIHFFGYNNAKVSHQSACSASFAHCVIPCFVKPLRSKSSRVNSSTWSMPIRQSISYILLHAVKVIHGHCVVGSSCWCWVSPHPIFLSLLPIGSGSKTNAHSSAQWPNSNFKVFFLKKHKTDQFKLNWN